MKQRSKRRSVSIPMVGTKKTKTRDGERMLRFFPGELGNLYRRDIVSLNLAKLRAERLQGTFSILVAVRPQRTLRETKSDYGLLTPDLCLLTTDYRPLTSVF